MKKYIILSFVSLVTFGSLVSCKKKKAAQEEATVVSQENAVAESSYNDLSTMSEEAVQGEEKFKSYKSDCVKIETTLDTAANVRFVTIDFGTENCMCADGRNRRGKVRVTLTGNYNQVGSVISMKTDNYFVDEYEVKGTRVATNVASYEYSIVVDGQIIKPNAGGTITWKCTKTRKQVEGTTTPFVLIDNVYEVTGSSEGTTAAAVNFKFMVNTPLKFQLGCRWIKSGVMTLSRDGKDDVVIDYGLGECDNKATATFGNKTKEITLNGW